MSLSKKQYEFLRRCEACPVDSWSAGATTVSTLRKLGLIEKSAANGCAINVITDKGRAVLAGTIDMMALLRESVKP